MIDKTSLQQLLMPLIKLCLQNSLGVNELQELIKLCYVKLAREMIEAQGEKANVSRLSVITGLQRREISRILQEGDTPRESLTLVSRVLLQWSQDKRFCTKTGTPKILSYEGKNSDFSKLVSAVSKDLHPGTVLFELKRSGNVEVVKGGLKLRRKTESLRSDPRKAYQVLAADIRDLLEAAGQNLKNPEDIPHLQARTEYDNIFLEDLPAIKEWLLKEGSEFHKKARDFISQFDRDLNPHLRKKAGGGVSLGTFSLVTGETDEK